LTTPMRTVLFAVHRVGMPQDSISRAISPPD